MSKTVVFPIGSSFVDCVNAVLRHKVKSFNELEFFSQARLAKKHFSECLSRKQKFKLIANMAEKGMLSNKLAADVITYVEMNNKYDSKDNNEFKHFEIQLSEYYKENPMPIDNIIKKFRYIGKDMIKPAQRVKKIKNQPMATYKRKQPKIAVSANRESVVGFHPEYL